MNILRGSQLIKTTGRALLYPALAVTATMVVLAFVALASGSREIYAVLFYLLFVPLVVTTAGAGMWFVGWILEGFADEIK